MTTELLNIIDTHAHIDLEDFDADRSEFLKRSIRGEFPEIKGKTIESGEKQFSMTAMILPGITAESSQKTIELSNHYNILFPGVGIHPNYTGSADENDWRTIERLSENETVIAIGETGLDLYWDKAPLDLQIDYFVRHIFLAKRRNLPIIIHCRDAENELMDVLRALRRWEKEGRERECSAEIFPEKGGKTPELNPLSPGLKHFAGVDLDALRSLPPLRGVIHSFSGGPETASELADLGFYLGFTGSVTFTGRKFAKIGASAKVVPNDRFLLETDSPFLTPHPFRGKLERNEPLMTVWTARRLAELRETTVAEIITRSAENACALFGEQLRKKSE